MKKIIIILGIGLTILLSLYFYNIFKYNVEGVYVNLYLNKPVGELLKAIPSKYVNHYWMTENRMLLGCCFVYENKDRLELYVKKFKYVDPFKKYREWDLEKFKKETIDNLEVIKYPDP